MNFLNLDPAMIDPNVAYLVLVVGLWIGVAAVYTPGTGVLEGIAGLTLMGSIILLLALPTNLWAVLLIVVGVASFHVIPFLKPEYARWALGGLALQVVGGLFLFSGYAIPWVLVVFTVAISLVYHFRVLMPILNNSRQEPMLTEDELLVGAEGQVLTPLTPIGTVRVRGEAWTATSDKPLKAGEDIVVIEREGLRLYVEKLKHKRTTHDGDVNQ